MTNMILPREDTDLWFGKQWPRTVAESAGRIGICRNAEKHWFEPNLTYTFSYFTHALDVQNFEVYIDLADDMVILKTLLNEEVTSKPTRGVGLIDAVINMA